MLNLKHNKYLGAISLLASGSMLGQLIGFVGSIFMTRLYTESEIGIMTTVISVSGIFASVINGRFDYAVVKERDDKKVFPLIALAIYFGICFTLIVSIGSWVYFLNQEGFISPFLASLFVFFILFITSFTNVFRSYNNRAEDYKTMTFVAVVRRSAEELSMILFGLLSFKVIGLLLSRVIGQFFGMRQQIKNIRSEFHRIFQSKKVQIVEAFQNHKRQLYYSAPAALMNSASYNLVSLSIGALFGTGILGVYAISYAVLGLPLSVISSNVSKVYFGEASKEFSETSSFVRSTRSTLFLMIPISILLWVLMYYLFPIIVPWIYGDAYRSAGSIIRILSPMFAIRFVSSSMNTGFVVSNKQNIEVIIQGLFIVSIFALSFVARYSGMELDSFLYVVSMVFSVLYLANLIVVWRLSHKKVKEII